MTCIHLELLRVEYFGRDRYAPPIPDDILDSLPLAIARAELFILLMTDPSGI